MTTEIAISTKVELPSPRLIPSARAGGRQFVVVRVDHEVYFYGGKFVYSVTLWGSDNYQNAGLFYQEGAPVPSELGQGDDLDPPAWFVEQANRIGGWEK